MDRRQRYALWVGTTRPEHPEAVFWVEEQTALRWHRAMVLAMEYPTAARVMAGYEVRWQNDKAPRKDT